MEHELCKLGVAMDETRTLDVKLRLWSGMANLKKLFLPLRPDPVILPTWGNDKCINNNKFKTPLNVCSGQIGDHSMRIDHA